MNLNNWDYFQKACKKIIKVAIRYTTIYYIKSVIIHINSLRFSQSRTYYYAKKLLFNGLYLTAPHISHIALPKPAPAV